MEKFKSSIVIIVKRLLFFFFPILLFVFVLHRQIFNLDVKPLWPRLLFYTILIGTIDLMNYKYSSVEEPVKSVGHLKDKIRAGRWKVLEDEEGAFVLRPRFDFPYSLLSGDRVYVRFFNGTARVEGPKYYVNNLVKDIQGKRNVWADRIASIVFFIVVLAIITVPVLYDRGVIADLRVYYHNYRARNVERIEIQDTNALGNAENNINNYGYGAEYNDHIFYVEDNLNLVRITKDLKDKTCLIEKSSGYGVSGLNIVDNWVFYSSGKTFNRMKTDGTGNEVIYRMGYLMDEHVHGNWVYFINPSDRFTVYRMDVNGQNLERLVNLPVYDIAIYDNRLFYSFRDDDEGFLESVDLEGQDKRTEMDIPVEDLIRWGGYYYFKGHDDYKLYRHEVGGSGKPQVLVDGRVSSYIVTDFGIYYTLHSRDVGYPGEGLYKIGLDGTGNTLLYDTRSVESLSQVGNWIFFESSDDNTYPSQKRLDLQTDEITVMD